MFFSLSVKPLGMLNIHIFLRISSEFKCLFSVHEAVRKVIKLEGQSGSSEPLLGKVHIQALICFKSYALFDHCLWINSQYPRIL